MPKRSGKAKKPAKAAGKAAAPAATPQGHDNLPGKEQGLYKSILVGGAQAVLLRNLMLLHLRLDPCPAQKHWETKRYKHAIKAADEILAKFPDHGGACWSTASRVALCAGRLALAAGC